MKLNAVQTWIKKNNKIKFLKKCTLNLFSFGFDCEVGYDDTIFIKKSDQNAIFVHTQIQWNSK